MKDVFGTEIKVGDTVAFAMGGRYKFSTGVVAKLTKKQVGIEEPGVPKVKGWELPYTWRPPQDVVIKVENEI